MSYAHLDQWISPIYQFNHIPISLVNQAGDVLASWPEEAKTNGLHFGSPFYRDFFSCSSDAPTLFTGPYLEQYVCFQDQTPEQYWVFGPAFTIIRDIQQALPLLPCFSGLSAENCTALAQTIYEHTPDQFCQIASYFFSSLTETAFDWKTFYTSAVQLPQPTVTEENLAQFSFPSPQVSMGDTPADGMPGILSSVKAGDPDGLKLQLLSSPTSLMRVLSSDPVKQAQYLMVSLATLVARVAIEGGLSREISYNLAELYIQKAEKSKDPVVIAEMRVQMLLHFVEKVAEQKTPDHYSPPIIQTIEYIYCNLHYNITLEELADNCELTPHYLSALFKKETGSTITQFVLSERINEAMGLLRYSTLSCQQISSSLAFSSHSHFSTAFKKLTGLTPKQYRSQFTASSTA